MLCATKLRPYAASMIKRLLVVALASVATSTSFVVEATADNRRERQAFEFEFVERICGGVEVRIWGQWRSASGFSTKGPSPFPYYFENGHGTHNFTNLQTGRTVSSVWNGVEKDVRITENGDGTFTLIALNSGREVMYGPDGARLGSWVGTTRWKLVVDYHGTPPNPDDDVVVGGTNVLAAGRRGADQCELFLAATT